jgi:inorganic pyrophosphatase
VRRRARRSDDVTPIVSDVVVEDAGNTYNRYEYDTKRRAVRLAETVLTYKSDSLEKARLTNSLGSDGEPLLAVLFVSLPTFPGCIVGARILGGFRDSEARLTLVGVPVADKSKEGYVALADLSRSERFGIERFLEREGRTGEPVEGAHLTTAIRSATEAFWEDRARKQSAVRAGAAWKATAPPSRNGDRGEAGLHTFAESMVPLLPQRFQDYIKQLLLPEERILAFVERPEATVHLSHVLNRQKLSQGLLVATDRQLLMMEEPLPPGSTMVAWGFIATTTAIERIGHVSIAHEGNAIIFSASISALGGTNQYSVAFPEECLPGLQDVAQVAENFIATPAQGVLRLYEVNPSSKDRTQWLQLAGEYPQLATLIETAAEPLVKSAAAGRPARGKGIGPALVATDDGLLLYRGGQKLGANPGRLLPLSAITSVTLVQSLFGGRFEIFYIAAGEAQSVVLSYLYPDSEPFVKAFLVVRTLLGRPLALAEVSQR